MSVKKIKTEITYRVPIGNYCNLIKSGTLGTRTKDLCRFCVKEGKGHRCALHNMPLDAEQAVLVKKTNDCVRAMLGYKSIVTDIVEKEALPTVEPKKLMKSTIQLYNKTVKHLLNQGYPRNIAEQVAQEHVLGGE